jgi:hypothetical protein
LEELVDDVVRRLQRKDLLGTVVKLKLRWSDFTTPTRQLTLPTPTADTKVLWEASQQLLRQLWQEERPVRLMGVGVSGLNPQTQLSLWDETIMEEVVAEEIIREEVTPKETLPAAPSISLPDDKQLSPAKQRGLQRAFAELQERFGEPMVQRGLSKPTQSSVTLPNVAP